MPYDFELGSSQYVSSGSTFTTSYPWSALAWIKVETLASFTTAGIVVGASTAGIPVIPYMAITAGGMVRFACDWSTGIGVWDATAGAVSNGVWACVAVSYAGTATTDDPVLYSRIYGTDSTLVSRALTEAATPTGGTMTTSGQTLYMGQRGDGARYFDGQIAFVQVWHRALAFGELCQAMVCPGSVRSSLQFYRPLMGDLTDWGGNSLSLTATGAASVSSGPPVCLDAAFNNSWAGVVAGGGGGGGAIPVKMYQYRQRATA